MVTSRVLYAMSVCMYMCIHMLIHVQWNMHFFRYLEPPGNEWTKCHISHPQRRQQDLDRHQ